MEPYSAWIKEPSHPMHGTRCIVTKHWEERAIVYFVDSPTISIVIPITSLSRRMDECDDHQTIPQA